jgi:hypothetical protein
MPIRSEIDEGEKILRFHVEGDWTTEDMISVASAGVRSIAGREGWDVLCDITRTNRASTPDEIRRLVQVLAAEGSALRGRRSAMVVSNPTSYGMMRMLAVHAEPIGIEVQIFNDVAAALRYLRPAEQP